MAKERLDSVNSNILGVILNKYKTETNSEYYNYYYHSQEEKEKEEKKKIIFVYREGSINGKNNL